MKDYICADIYPLTEWGTREGNPHLKGVRCWKRESHEGTHMAVIPNRDQEVVTRPEVVRWGSPNLVAALG